VRLSPIDGSDHVSHPEPGKTVTQSKRWSDNVLVMHWEFQNQKTTGRLLSCQNIIESLGWNESGTGFLSDSKSDSPKPGTGRFACSFAAQNFGWVTQSRTYSWTGSRHNRYSHQCKTSKGLGS